MTPEATPNVNEWMRKAELYKIKVQHILEESGPQRSDEINDMIAKHVAGLMEEYPDYQHYAMYHAISGSGVVSVDDPAMPILHEDFPGKDSIAEYIDNVVMLG